MPSLSFASPDRLLLLLVVVALAAAYAWRLRRASRYALRLPGLSLLADLQPRRAWRRHVPAALVLLALTGTTTAFAEPRAEVQVPRERATVVVALDVSLSMLATDVAPDRITEAKAAAVDFVRSLPPRFNVGLVAFAGSASVVVPATQEHSAVVEAVQTLTLDSGTAIGEAVTSSLEAVLAVPGGTQTAPARVVLLSDGASTKGRPVEQASEQARALGVPVSTIAYGTAEGTVTVEGQTVQVPVDAPALERLADDTGGTSYAAASGDELASVYDDIGSDLDTTTEQREVSAGVTALAALTAVGAAAAALVWGPRLP